MTYIRYDKLLGCFIGGFIGDAIGAPHELRGALPLSQYTGIIRHPIVLKKTRGRKEDIVYPIGTFTDDSQMTLYLIKSIIENNGNYVRDDVIMKYLEFAGQTKMLGRNTRNLLTVKTMKGYLGRVNKHMDPSIESNGTLMRASPLCIFNNYQTCIQDSSITNTSNVNSVCNIIYLYGIRYAIESKSKSEIQELYISLANQYGIETIITAVNQAINGDRRDVDERRVNPDGSLSRRSNKGWIVHGIYAALWSLLHFDNYRDGVNAVVLLGGDTDTLAKIAGDLLGAFYGYENIMSDDVTKYNGQIVFQANANYLGTFVSDVQKMANYYQN